LAPNAQREQVVHPSGATRSRSIRSSIDFRGMFEAAKSLAAVLSLLALLKAAA
jgi:hypothetical protein